MIMWNELGISGGTAIVILIALYFVIKWAVKNGIKEAYSAITGKKTDEDVRNEKELKELGFELEDKYKFSGGCFMKKKVLAIMLVTVSIMLISACGKKEKLYEIPDLSQYKTDYVGDSSNVINIVSGQEYPEGYSYDSIEIQSETEPYGLTVFLKDEPSAAKLEDELQVNADITFDLIGNLGTIDYKTADSKGIIASYER